ncbi:YcgJ family protein [Paraburkholderia strydomiana]|uniref:YcgJ family protein n=1 Tax=Paraburkholderia strydomiana TaxID=1245417 RepID=UPI00203583FE|nr:YcgJ family protein [Paraburkholderia strydomiana]
MSSVTGRAPETLQAPTIQSPAPGVLCDRYMCANSAGVSRELTTRYLGRKAATRLYSQGTFDPRNFTFSNGVYCDVKERLCRENRFYGADGKHSGVVSTKYTLLLFGK